MSKLIKGKKVCADCEQEFVWVEQISPKESFKVFKIYKPKENESMVDGNRVYCTNPRVEHPNYLTDEDREKAEITTYL